MKSAYSMKSLLVVRSRSIARLAHSHAMLSNQMPVICFLWPGASESR
jgi:hypothetical protein